MVAVVGRPDVPSRIDPQAVRHLEQPLPPAADELPVRRKLHERRLAAVENIDPVFLANRDSRHGAECHVSGELQKAGREIGLGRVREIRDQQRQCGNRRIFHACEISPPVMPRQSHQNLFVCSHACGRINPARLQSATGDSAMISIFDNRASRRRFLTAGAIGGGLSLAGLLRAEAAAGIGSSQKAVINVHLDGGPPHLDMIDLKPQAPSEIRGEFSPIATKIAGYHLCEHLPQAGRRGRQARVHSLADRRGQCSRRLSVPKRLRREKPRQHRRPPGDGLRRGQAPRLSGRCRPRFRRFDARAAARPRQRPPRFSRPGIGGVSPRYFAPLRAAAGGGHEGGTGPPRRQPRRSARSECGPFTRSPA